MVHKSKPILKGTTYAWLRKIIFITDIWSLLKHNTWPNLALFSLSSPHVSPCQSRSGIFCQLWCYCCDEEWHQETVHNYQDPSLPRHHHPKQTPPLNLEKTTIHGTWPTGIVYVVGKWHFQMHGFKINFPSSQNKIKQTNKQKPDRFAVVFTANLKQVPVQSYRDTTVRQVISSILRPIESSGKREGGKSDRTVFKHP